MSDTLNAPVAPARGDLQSVLAARLAAEGNVIARRWLDRVVALNVVDPEHVFPTRELLDHIPELIRGIAQSLHPVSAGGVDVASNPLILAKARELGALRHTLGFSLQGVLKEYEVFGAILLHFLGEEGRVAAEEGCGPGEAAHVTFDVARRLHLALSTVLQATVDTYVSSYVEGIERFERSFAEQLHSPLAAAHGASALLADEDSPLTAVERDRLERVVERSLSGMERTTRELIEYSAQRFRHRLERQRLRISDVVSDVRKQLRDTAEARGVQIFQVTPMPELDVDAAGLETVLEALITNAIQYCDEEKPTRYVSVGCVHAEDDGWVVYVRDNGSGMTPEQATALVEPSARRATPTPRESLPSIADDGERRRSRIGLSLAREAIERWGGRLWVDSAPRKGSIFFFTLPSR